MPACWPSGHYDYWPFLCLPFGLPYGHDCPLTIVQEPEELLNSWSSNIGRLLTLVEKSCQQIQKECMIHKVAAS